MGRPKKDFDWELLETLASFPDVILQEDIAQCMKVSLDTVANKIKEKHGVTFSEFRKQRQGITRKNLFAWQLKAAQRGSVPMLIWLGKNYLNQKEPKQEQEVVINDEKDKLKAYAEKLKEMASDESGSKQSYTSSKN